MFFVIISKITHEIQKIYYMTTMPIQSAFLLGWHSAHFEMIFPLCTGCSGKISFGSQSFRTTKATINLIK